MMGIFSRKRKKLDALSKKLDSSGKVIKKQKAAKVKGGKTSRSKIWNGCGGTIPQ